jgi:hypothetical protein
MHAFHAWTYASFSVCGYCSTVWLIFLAYVFYTEEFCFINEGITIVGIVTYGLMRLLGIHQHRSAVNVSTGLINYHVMCPYLLSTRWNEPEYVILSFHPEILIPES